mgnify:CR=1 FL=1
MQEEASLKAMPIPKEEAPLKAMPIPKEEAPLKAMPIPKEEAPLKQQMKKDETKKAPKKDELLRSFFVHP